MQKARRKTREELDQEARDRKRQKKTSWSCAGQPRSGAETPRQAAKARTHQKIHVLAVKTPIPLGVTEKSHQTAQTEE